MVSIDILRATQLFKGLIDSQLREIASISQEESHKAGSLMLKEESRAQRLFVLLEGRIMLKMRVGTAPHLTPSYATIAIVTAGQAFNWAALIEPHITTLTAECLEPVKVISIEGAKLIGLMEKDTAVGYHIMKKIAGVIASRLRLTRQTLVAQHAMAAR